MAFGSRACEASRHTGCRGIAIELIGAGRIMAEDEFRHAQSPRWPSAVVSGIRALALMKPRPYSRLSRADRIPRDPVGEVVIVRREPRIAFRAVENHMNYAYLGERRSTKAAENFPVFVADLCARAEDAYITPSTRSLLARQEPGEHAFPSSQALTGLRNPSPAMELVSPRPRFPSGRNHTSLPGTTTTRTTQADPDPERGYRRRDGRIIRRRAMSRFPVGPDCPIRPPVTRSPEADVARSIQFLSVILLSTASMSGRRG